MYGIQITAGLCDENAVYLIESVVGLHICKRVRSPTVFVGLQLTREDRNDDRFAACLQLALYPGVWEGGGETPGTHGLHMC